MLQFFYVTLHKNTTILDELKIMLIHEIQILHKQLFLLPHVMFCIISKISA